MFDNTKNVTFDEKVYDKITDLISQEGEKVALEQPVMAQVYSSLVKKKQNICLQSNQNHTPELTWWLTTKMNIYDCIVP